jgi:hypothetical protein
VGEALLSVGVAGRDGLDGLAGWLAFGAGGATGFGDGGTTPGALGREPGCGVVVGLLAGFATGDAGRLGLSSGRGCNRSCSCAGEVSDVIRVSASAILSGSRSAISVASTRVAETQMGHFHQFLIFHTSFSACFFWQNPLRLSVLSVAAR